MTAFSRFHALMALAAAAIASKTYSTHGQAVQALGGYTSRGKNKTTRHDAGGTRRAQRHAMKKRNQQRNRLAHR